MEAVVFDMDGVIFDSERLVIDVWKTLSEKYHFKDIEKVRLACLGTSKETSKKIFLDYYGDDFPYDQYALESSQLYHQRYDGKVPLKKGVTRLLKWLKAHDYKIGLASSTRLYTVKLQLENAGIIDFFDVIIGGDDVHQAKPDPEIYQMACLRLGVAPSDAYGIEDSYNGIRSCFAAGLHPIMVPDLKEPTDEMRERAEVILDDLDDVLSYLKKQSS